MTSEVGSQNDRIAKLCREHLKKIKLTDKATCDVVGPAVMPVKNQAGMTVPVLGWGVFVTLEHNKVIGQKPLLEFVTMNGLLPEDEKFLEAVTTGLESTRQMRDEANAAPVPISAGLRGKKLQVGG